MFIEFELFEQVSEHLTLPGSDLECLAIRGTPGVQEKQALYSVQAFVQVSRLSSERIYSFWQKHLDSPMLNGKLADNERSGQCILCILHS